MSGLNRRCEVRRRGYALTVSESTAQPPDPDPAVTPGLEPGGGVSPGSTPPDSAQTSGLGEPEPRPRRKLTVTAVLSLVALVAFIALFVATGVYLLTDIF
jgi:Family of unknown function (DUF6480)